MPKDSKDSRRRMVVEEVVSDAPPSDNQIVEEIKEKVEELQNITQDIGQSVEKSTEVQEEIVKAAEEALPPAPQADIRPPMPVTYSSNMNYRKGPGMWVVLVPGVLLLGALLGGIVFYQKSLQTPSEATPAPIASIEPIVAPSASPSAKLDLTKYAINIENGSGIPGTAGSAKDLLTKAGFKVSATGNADTYDFTNTIIQTKSTVPAAFVTKLTTTLSGIYSVGTPKTLSNSSKDDVVVTIGSSKAQ